MRWNLRIFFLTFLLFGVIFAASESNAQPVPPRVQGLQLIQPLTPPPEVPVEKEIKELKQRPQPTPRELIRMAERGKATAFLKQLLAEAKNKLECYERNPADCRSCDLDLTWPTDPERLQKSCRNRAEAYRRDIKELQSQITSLQGGKK